MPGLKNKLKSLSNRNKPLVSIITPSYNSEETISQTIKSISSQTYPNIEHIVIDGNSSDSTLSILKKYKDEISKIISEKDKGVYDAMNKGIYLSSGDIIGILNSDDCYANKDIIENIVESMSKSQADICWGNLEYVNKKNPNKVIRYWKSSSFKKNKLISGWIPPHPTVFIRKEIYKKYGKFDLTFPISADYELLLRFLTKKNIKTCYLPKVLVKMKTGGKSGQSLLNRIKGNKEIYRAWKKNGLKLPLNYFIKKIIFRRLPQYVKAKNI
jgi:glycosyltransferase